MSKELIEFDSGGKRTRHVIADGGLSAFNNPALAALILCALKQPSASSSGISRGFQWELGEDKVLLVSVGTGWLRKTRRLQELLDVYPMDNFIKSLGKTLSRIFRWRPLFYRLQEPILQGLMGDSNFLGQAILTWMSNTETRMPLHGAAEDFANEFLHPGANRSKHFLTYLRFDVALHEPSSYPTTVCLKNPTNEEAEILGTKFYDFVDGRNVNDLIKIGEYVGRQIVKSSQFANYPVPSFWSRQNNTPE